MTEAQQQRIAGAVGGLIVGGLFGGLIIAIALSSTGRPTTINNILPLALAAAIAAGIAGYSYRGIGKAFPKVLDVI